MYTDMGIFSWLIFIWILFTVIGPIIKRVKSKGGFGNIMKEIQEAQNRQAGGYPDSSEQEIHPTNPSSYRRNTSNASELSPEDQRAINKLLKDSTSYSTNSSNKRKSQPLNIVDTSIDDNSVYTTEKSAYRIESKEDWKQAFVWSEIFRRKYN